MTQQSRKPYQKDNIFALIIAGQASAHKVYEDDYTLAFMDLMPQADGHTLVIPKCEAIDLLDADPEYLARTIQATQKIAIAVKAAFSADGVMVAQLNGAAAGQTVFHLHFHIIPRQGGVDFALHAKDMADAEVLAAHAARIRECL